MRVDLRMVFLRNIAVEEDLGRLSYNWNFFVGILVHSGHANLGIVAGFGHGNVAVGDLGRGRRWRDSPICFLGVGLECWMGNCGDVCEDSDIDHGSLWLVPRNVVRAHKWFLVSGRGGGSFRVSPSMA